MDILGQKLIIRDKTIERLKTELDEVNKLNSLLEYQLNEHTKTIQKLSKTPKKRGPKKKQIEKEDGSFNDLIETDGSFQNIIEKEDGSFKEKDIGEFKHIESEILMNPDKSFSNEHINHIIETYNGSINSKFIHHKQHDVLTNDQCLDLIKYIDKYEQSDKNDFKLNITNEVLVQIIGDETFQKLISLYDGNYNTIYIRKVTGNNSLIDFHKDYSKQTMKIALNSPPEFEGGDLVYLSDGLIHKLDNLQGTITIHNNDIIHGVTPITKGTRYSLFILYTP